MRYLSYCIILGCLGSTLALGQLKVDSLDPNAGPATYTATTKNYRWMPVQSGAAMTDDPNAATLHGSWHLSRFKGWTFTQGQTGAGEASLVAKTDGCILVLISPADVRSATQSKWSISPATSLVVEHDGRLEPRVAAYRGVAEGEVLTLPISTRDKSVILFRAPAEKDKSIPAGPMMNGDRPDIDALLKAAGVVEPAPDWSAIGAKAQSILLVRIVTENLASAASVSDLIYLIRASEYIPMAYSQSKPLGVFLSKHPAFGRTLFRAMAEQPRGRDSSTLSNLSALLARGQATVLAHPGLSIAISGSFAQCGKTRSQNHKSTLAETFGWYTNPKRTFRYSMRKMPFELARFVADTNLSIAERKWAYAKYHKSIAPKRWYKSVPYDTEVLTKRAERKMTGVEYTLPNLQATGGVCHDQAYFSVQVLKSLGIPATAMGGTAAGGIGHAWVGFFEPKGRSSAWNCTPGRYPAYRVIAGRMHSPTDNGMINDSELMVTGAASLLAKRRLEEADAFTAAAKIAREQQIEPEWIESALNRAMAKNFTHQGLWKLVREMRKNDEMSLAMLNRYMDVLMGKTAKKYPDYSATLLLDLIPTIPEPTLRIAAYKKAAKAYPTRRSLQGKLVLKMAAEYLAIDEEKKALAMYQLAVTRFREISSVVVPAADGVAKYYDARGRQKQATGMYRKLFNTASKDPRAHISVRQASAHSQLGHRLAKRLQAEGKTKEADQVLAKIK